MEMLVKGSTEGQFAKIIYIPNTVPTPMSAVPTIAGTQNGKWHSTIGFMTSGYPILQSELAKKLVIVSKPRNISTKAIRCYVINLSG